MSAAVRRNSSKTGNGVESDPDGIRTIRRELSTEYTHSEWDNMMESSSRDFKTSRGSIKGTSGASDDNIPTVLAMQLAMVEGPDRLPADEGTQEVLCRKLCVLEADLSGVVTLISELSAHFVSINSEERTIFITFKTLEEIWKFSTYHKMGFLGQCMENLLMNQEFWLISLDQHSGIEISIKEETLNLMYKGFLMQEGSFFGCCTANQMFDSSTSGSDLYLEKGDIALFEPPFLGSGWTVLSLADGARGTKPKPALEPVIPFHEWFLKSCPESILVGGGKDTSDLPFQIAGVCETTEEYDADGPDELSFQAGERIVILGLLVACFDWFMGKLERTGDIGLVKTKLVKTTSSFCESSDIFLKDKDRQIATWDQDKIKEDTIALLKKICQSDVGTNYKLDLAKEIPGSVQNKTHQTELNNLKQKVKHILSEVDESQRNDVPSGSSKQQMKKEADDTESSQEIPQFSVCLEQDNTSPDEHHAMLSFLSSRDHQPEFLLLYSAYPEFLISHFEGHSDEEEIVAYLGVARELARKKHVSWAQSRICFLLGQLCAGRSKFSQARVYYEEALNVPRDCFTDMFLLSAIYSNLALIYLTQKNHEKCVSFSERLSALLMAVPDCLFGCEDPEVFKYVLKKAVLAKNQPAEARACFLLAKLHLKLKDGMSAIPFIERLLILADEVPDACDETLSQVFLVLARLYSDQRQPRLAESCAKRASLQVGATVSHCLCSISLLLENASELYGVAVPTQVAPYLTRAAALVSPSMEPVLGHIHALCLSWLFHIHGMPDRAVRYMSTVLDHSGMSSVGQSDTTAALLWLAWLYICNQQPGTALEVLDAVLSSLPEHCTTQLEGVVYNMRAISYRHSADIRQATESYRAAIEICEEFEDRRNWAIALANFGLMCLQIKAKRLAEEYLTQSVELFSELEDEEHELSFILVLLDLGKHFVSQGNHESGKLYYEWALLSAMFISHIDSQLQATRHLCQLYEEVCPDEAQCIIYNEHQLNLLQRIGDKSLEGEILEKISQLYLNLATKKANRAALDYTKRSLGIFIDLGRKRKEAHAWLKAGKIYHILQQTELVDLYVQVAQDMALSTGDTLFTLEMLEAAGDVFFNSSQDREKAICFYRDRALPIAVKTSSVRAQLRLCNKLSELLLQLGQCSEAIEYARTALDISSSLADDLNERVAFHRLATLYHCLGQFEMAEHHFLKALSLCPSPLQYDEEALYYVRVYKTLGDIVFYDVKDPFDAAGYYHLALAAAMDLGNKRSQLGLCTQLATIYHNCLMDRELSLFFYQRARAFANDLHIRRINLAPDYSFRTTAQYKNTITGPTR
ncbi:SH3 domain and tetratricopeptide repeat-containing protein 1 isoform X2 [Sinocyclocheilus anshuiensis]|uniref:SH3 domain and tetratricopeptide repeat-containing protein 1 isoform X2 n=1 Tax=Sinocyclocheilus anshuiensis TaxID=1608454 RepID=UPI0007B9E639|nr:PREDICTED: SH3 domain and tetratricopeptide repeat-containing protein 1-like isoform X2 [Sinocyclocheilus anshuiensis]